MRKIRHCPCCAYSFKNFKWRKTWKYDGDVACCPKCLLPAIEWKDFKPKRLLELTQGNNYLYLWRLYRKKSQSQILR